MEQVGVEVDESVFVDAGTPVSGDFRCAECCYGAVVQRSLPPCPMCGGTVWELLGQPASRPRE